MSAISGVMGSMAQTDAAKTAAQAQRDSTAMQIEAYNKQADQTRADFQPYADLGKAGIANIYGQPGAATIAGITDAESNSRPGTYADAMQGLGTYGDAMQGRTFDETMGGYDPATAVERERKMGLQSLGNKMASRGIRGMGAVNQMSDFNDQKNADLSNRQLAYNQQRYGARLGEANTMYSNTRNEATQKYQGAVNDWQLRKGAMQDRYNNLLKLVDTGRNAQGTVSQNTGMATQGAANAMGQMGQANANAAMAAGQGSAQMMRGLGQMGTQAVGAGLRSYGNQPANNSSGLAASQGGWGSSGSMGIASGAGAGTDMYAGDLY